ncbi:unnamed protein product [Lymnaea stagnalis]|uniref:Uncharacterized protein n=1 Tax=Lymnaea stagnalis TaxID=6523 RepID=A0AAV2HXD3_LYMST
MGRRRMAAIVNSRVGPILLILCSLVSITVGDYCIDTSYPFNSNYCPYGCCSYNRSLCCSSNIGLIVGLCVGGGALVVIIVVVIICCRRRRYAGVIVRNQAAQPAIVVAQNTSTSQAGVFATGGYQPGYNPQPYGAYPQYPQGYPAAAYPQGPGGYPPQGPGGYPPQVPGGYPPQASGGYPPQAPGGFVQAPPNYDSLNKHQVS